MIVSAAAARGRIRLLGLKLALLLAFPVYAEGPQTTLKIPDAGLEPLYFSDLQGWEDDDHVVAFRTFVNSCRPMLKDPRAVQDTRPMAAALRTVCHRAKAVATVNEGSGRRFFEENFRPVHIFRLDNPLGLLTGYYEPIVVGSRMPTPMFSVPLYRRPDDLVLLGSHTAAEGFPNKAEVGRRVKDGVSIPYFDRGAIEDGALDGRHLEICWVKDPIDAMIVQIEGSARVRLEDGVLLRVNYDAHNGLPFTPVGRILIERNLIPKDEISLERIRRWMLANPEPARDVRRFNRSFVFFRITALDNEEEAIGAQGVRLTPGRSIAVDKALHVYGTPFFIAADLPTAGGHPPAPYRRLMIAQDTGSAIVGPARADIFLGAGEEAGRVAGRIRHQGHFSMMVPRDIDPAAAAAHTPLPRPRPILQVQAAHPKPKSGKQSAADSAVKTNPARAGRKALRHRPR
jgi:peptidoglycan lytic transglycosylase A